MKKTYRFYLKFTLALTCILFSIGNLSGQTDWIKYECNPLFDIGTSGSWESTSNAQPSVIFDGEIYHMWYSGESNTGSSIGYATSVDGIHWEKYFGNPVLAGISDSWENDGVSSPHVVWDGTTFHMWYAGFQITTKVMAASGYATSSDGINWTKYENNPILVPSQSWEGGEICILPRVAIGDSIFHMWYASGHSFDQQNPAKEYKIGYAASTDGINRIKNENNPVLEIPGNSAEPSTIILKDSLYQMWFSCDFFPDNRWRIGYAIGPLSAHDIWVVAMPEHIASVPIFVNNYVPKVNVWNVGSGDESSVNISCKIDSSGVNLYTDTKTIDVMESGQFRKTVFEEFKTFDKETYSVTFYSQLQNDEKLCNDTLHSQLPISS